MDKIKKMMVRRAIVGVVLAWLVVALGGLIVLGLSGCVQGPVGPLPPVDSSACGHVAGPCCAQDVCKPGLTCLGRDSGMASHTCFTVETTNCGGTGEPCCAIKESDTGLPSWCLAGLGCATDGHCS